MNMFVVVWYLAIGFVFSGMWSELLMTSAISCHQCTSVRKWSVRSLLR